MIFVESPMILFEEEVITYIGSTLMRFNIYIHLNYISLPWKLTLLPKLFVAKDLLYSIGKINTWPQLLNIQMLLAFFWIIIMNDCYHSLKCFVEL